MPQWKKEIKKLAEDFCISQVKINRVLKSVEAKYSNKQVPPFYKGNQNAYLYDTAHREFIKLLYA